MSSSFVDGLTRLEVVPALTSSLAGAAVIFLFLFVVCSLELFGVLVPSCVLLSLGGKALFALFFLPPEVEDGSELTVAFVACKFLVNGAVRRVKVEGL